MFWFKPLGQQFGFNPDDYLKQPQQPDQWYASFTPTQTIEKKPSISWPIIWQKQGIDVTSTPIPLSQADYQKAIAPDSVPHSKWKGLTVKEGQKLDALSGGDKYKAEDLYKNALLIKSNKTFINAREEQRASMLEAMSQEQDQNKKQNMNLMYKVSQFADYAREQALKTGNTNVNTMNDKDIIGKLLQNDTHIKAFDDFINDRVDINTLVDTIAPWYRQKQEEEAKAKIELQSKVDWNIIWDITWWLAKSATATAELWAKAGDWIWYNLVKTIFWEEKANEVKAKLGDSFGDTIDKTLKDAWVNIDSTSFKVGKWAWDFAQLLAGTEIVKWIPAVTKIVQWLEWAWNVWKITWMATEWALQSVWYSAIADKELPSVQEAGIGAWLNVALGVWWQAVSKWLKYAGNKLQLSGLINPQKLEYVQNALREGWDQVDNVTEWMNARNLVGSKKTIISKLQEEGKKTYTAVREAVKQADDVVQPIQDTSVKWALEELLSITQWAKSPQKKEVFNKLQELLQKHDSVWLKPSEIQGVKDSLDELMSIYTLAWDVKAWVQKADLADLRSNIRWLLENTVSKATGTDIAMLNRDTSVAYKLAQGIGKKENAESIRELLSPFAPSAIGGLYGGYQGNTPEEKMMYAIWWFLWWRLAWSTRIKTWLWRLAKTASKAKLPLKWSISGLASDQIEQVIHKE